MTIRFGFFIVLLIFISCKSETLKDASPPTILPLEGTWKLMTGTIIENGDTIVTGYTQNSSFIKIINNSHFAFIHHDLNKGKDSSALFSAGGGRYSLTDSTYVEHLEYCSAREWEANDFTFTITIKGDTLIQRGIEKVESAGINRINIEKYIREKE